MSSESSYSLNSGTPAYPLCWGLSVLCAISAIIMPSYLSLLQGSYSLTVINLFLLLCIYFYTSQCPNPFDFLQKLLARGILVFLPLGLSLTTESCLCQLAAKMARQSWQGRFVLCFIVAGVLESHVAGHASCVPAGGKPWSVCLFLGKGSFQKGAVAPFDPFHVATGAATAGLFALSLNLPSSLARSCPSSCSCSCTTGNSQLPLAWRGVSFSPSCGSREKVR